MYIDRIIYPIYTLGPKKRIAIWFSGCSKRCKGCANPELWERKKSQAISLNNVKKILENAINKNDVEGITFTGGDPLEQDGLEMLELVKFLKKFENVDILVYTGYLKKEVEKKENIKEMLKLIDVLIDGRYVEKLNDNMVKLRGSSNQKIYYINENKTKLYEKYMKDNGRKLQNVYYNNKLISIGIHNRLEKN